MTDFIDQALEHVEAVTRRADEGGNTEDAWINALFGDDAPCPIHGTTYAECEADHD